MKNPIEWIMSRVSDCLNRRGRKEIKQEEAPTCREEETKEANEAKKAKEKKIPYELDRFILSRTCKHEAANNRCRRETYRIPLEYMAYKRECSWQNMPSAQTCGPCKG